MTTKTRIGLLFGSFNPIHVGHLFVAEMAVESGNVDFVWFVVSPESPYKTGKGILAAAKDRFEMVQNAIEYSDKFSASDVEFTLPYPSFTCNTLEKLKELNPDLEFHFICGTDVYVDIPQWEGGDKVIELSNFLVYPRNTTVNYTPENMADKTTFLNGVPILEISSTFLREQIKNDKTTKHLLSEPVIKYIKQNNLYK